MVASSKVIKVGPWGGHGGSPWDDGPHRGVRSITVTYARFLESMRVEYVDRSGRPVLAEKHGGGTRHSLSAKVRDDHLVQLLQLPLPVCPAVHCSNSAIAQVELDYPCEFVTGVSGCYRAAHGGSPPVVRSLTFATSRGAVHGPFGDAEADAVPFAYPMEGGVVVGFAGRSGWHLDALGLYVAALRDETLGDVVQERGLTAYRAFVYGDDERARARRHQSKKKPFEWCYK
ncbi:unnamed protein product [Urochloa decumbens]|uniref:Jacalin-type lectin domain-containing protein n=1 Tax=Urochloa decumbens TaxID=240449 RepID=A0ABC8ZHZ5_9POAL